MAEGGAKLERIPSAGSVHFRSILASLLAVLIGLGGCTREPALTALTESSWMIPSNENIRAMLEERMQHNGVGIVVGVIDADGRQVVAHGRSGSNDARPLDGDTVFQIGSITKGLTTLLLADMVERGEVTLDDNASMYLPEGVSMPERGRPIILRDLATHTSGLPSMPTNYVLEAQPDPYEAYSVERLHEFLSSHALEREPGTETAYSNLGVALLGRLLANRMETDYEALLTERVLDPLDMGSTSIKLSDDQQSRLAPGHDRYLEPVHTWEMATLPASGSLRSTANDMLKLIAAYLGYSNTSLNTAMTLQLRDHIPQSDRIAALGWGIRADGVVLHSGGKQGYRSGAAFDSNTGIGAVVLANARTDDRPIDIALHLVTGEPLKQAPHAPEDKARVEVPNTVLDSYAGRYRLPEGDQLEVTRNGSRLVVRYPSYAVLEFLATGRRDFFYNTGNDEITFEVDASGRVIGLILYGDGKAEGGGELALRLAN